MKTNILKGIQILDGGTGRQIKKRGLPFKQPQWSAEVLKQNPEALIDIHSDFIKNGAQIVTANTYAVVPFHISTQGFLAQGPKLIGLACEMVIKARKQFPEKNILVALSVPPMFGSYRYDLFEQGKDKAEEYYKLFLESAKPYFQDIDIFICETLSSIDEGLFLSKLLQSYQKPYILSFSLDDNTQQLRKGKIEDIRKIISEVELKPQAVSINCSFPETVTASIKALRESVPQDIKICCYANNFVSDKPKKVRQANSDSWEIRDDIHPEDYEALAREWIKMGADIVGGCCGIGPEYMPYIIKAFESKELK